MATHTHNHLHATAHYTCITGPWLGEESAMGLNFAVGGGSSLPAGAGRPDVNDGQITLNTFDCHTVNQSHALTISANPGTVTQQWSGDGLPPTEQVTDNDTDFFFTTVGAFFIGLKENIPSPWRLNYLKLYAVDDQGHSPLGPSTWTPTTPIFGSTGNYQSPENAVVISLYTAHHARAGRGRLYFGPVTSSGLQSDGTLATALTGALGAAMQTLQNAVRTRGTPGNGAVYSGIVWNQRKTTGCVINKVRVGDEIDRQERRTKKRPEVYTNWDVT